MPGHGTFLQSRKSSQHDHGGQQTPIMGSTQHLQLCIWEFHPKRTSIHGPKGPILSWAGRFCQTHGHLLSSITTGKNARWCGAGQSDPQGDSGSPSPPVETLGSGTSILSGDVIQLQKEENRALGCLLVTRSSLNAHWRKKVSDFEMALCQNDSETTEAIKEAKALCMSNIRGAEVH